MNPEVTAIVPIKKDSERLPKKNFKMFNGKPLYHWVLETLESVDEIDTIVVNTNAEEIIEHGESQFDIEVSERPKRFYNDPTTRDIIEYEVHKTDSDMYIQTYCTNPLVESSTYSEAIQEFINTDNHDSLFSVTRHQKRLYDSQMNPINHDPTERKRTQDLPPIYEDNSNIYVYRKELYNKDDHEVGAVPIGENPLFYEMDEIEAIDIDIESEFKLAEYFHRKNFLNQTDLPSDSNI